MRDVIPRRRFGRDHVALVCPVVPDYLFMWDILVPKLFNYAMLYCLKNTWRASYDGISEFLDDLEYFEQHDQLFSLCDA